MAKLAISTGEYDVTGKGELKMTRQSRQFVNMYNFESTIRLRFTLRRVRTLKRNPVLLSMGDGR